MRSISSVSIYISYSAGSNKNLIGMPIIPFGFVGKSLVVNLFVRKARAIHLKKPSQPGETPMSNNRFAKYIVDLRNFVLLKTYRKRATEDHILRAQIVKIRVPYGCGPTRIQLRGRVVITENRRR